MGVGSFKIRLIAEGRAPVLKKTATGTILCACAYIAKLKRMKQQAITRKNGSPVFYVSTFYPCKRALSR